MDTNEKTKARLKCLFLEHDWDTVWNKNESCKIQKFVCVRCQEEILCYK